MHPYSPNISFFDDTLKLLPLQIEANTATLHFEAALGLYQFTAVADGSTFDWESLYINLELFGNKGQRTGPWDFDLTDDNRALMPSFWVELDGERLGLWYFQRVSLADIAAKKFRGNVATEVLSLPIFPELRDEKVELVVKVLLDVA